MNTSSIPRQPRPLPSANHSGHRTVLPHLDITPLGANGQGSQSYELQQTLVIDSKVEARWTLMLYRLDLQYVPQWRPHPNEVWVTTDFLLVGPEQVALEVKSRENRKGLISEVESRYAAANAPFDFPLIIVGCELPLKSEKWGAVGVFTDSGLVDVEGDQRWVPVVFEGCDTCGLPRFLVQGEALLRPCGHPVQHTSSEWLPHLRQAWWDTSRELG